MPSLMLEIGANIARLQSDMSKAQKTVDSFASSAKAAFGAVAGYIVGGQMVSALTDMSRAYMEQERAINKMSSAMKNQGDFSKSALKDMEDFASEIQNTTTVADESALAVMANLKSYGMLNEEVKNATQVAIDFASAKREEGMTIEQASEIIGKAYIGQTERLKRYGIIVDEAKTRAEKFDQVMAQLTERFGGAGAAELETYEGKLKLVSNQFGEVKENVGKLTLAFATGFTPQIQSAIKYLQDATEGVLMFFDATEKGAATKRRMEILDEIHNLEGELSMMETQAAAPGLFGRLWNAILGKDGGEVARRRLEELKAQLMETGAVLETVRRKEETVSPGGKRFIPVEENQADRDKWLSGYLRDVDKRMEAEVKRNEVLGQMYLQEQEWRDDELANREKQVNELEDLFKQVRDKQIEADKAANKDMVKLAEFTAEQMQKNFSDFFFDTMQGKFSSLADFAKATFQTIQRAASDYLGQALTEALFGVQNKAGGRSGGILGGLLSGLSTAASGTDAFAALALIHRGGEVGRDSFPMRYVPAGTLAGAPRLHGGLASDEYPAILQKGEKVISKDQAGGGGQNVNIMISAVDARSFAELAARNPAAITGPIMEALQKGGMLRNAIRGVM